MSKNKISCTIKHKEKDISPEKLSAKELAEFLLAFEKTIFLTARKSDPLINRETFLFGLTQINKGSVELSFQYSHPELVNQAINNVAKSINTQQLRLLPKESYEALTETIKVLDRLNSTATFAFGDESGTPTLVLDSESFLLEPKETLVTGESTLYGQLVRLGGRNEISADIKPLDDGQLIHCRLTQELARELSPKLYSDVGVNGIATWDINTYDIKNFTITEILPYEGTDIVNAMKNLAQALGQHYKDIDPDQHIKDLREDKE